MSEQLLTKMKDHTITTFWGGDAKGVCAQVQASAPLKIHETIGEQLQEEGFILLTMEEASALCTSLAKFIKEEAMRRQALLKEELKQLNLVEKTIWHEVASFNEDMFEVPKTAVAFVSKYCPKVHK